MVEEEWRENPNYPGYKFSSLGNVLGLRGKPLTISKNARDESVVNIRTLKGKTTRRISTVILESFTDDKPNLRIEAAEHINGNKNDNRVCNLRWRVDSDLLLDEEWRQFQDSDYMVSNMGNVRGPYGFLLSQFVVKGYLRVAIHSVPLGVHQIVCIAFHGEKPSDQHQVAHNNGNPLDNRAENLRWATVKENAADRKIHGTEGRGGARGEASFHHVLKESQILEIRARFKNYQHGMIAQLAREYGITPQAMNAIYHGKSWSWLK